MTNKLKKDFNERILKILKEHESKMRSNNIKEALKRKKLNENN